MHETYNDFCLKSVLGYPPDIPLVGACDRFDKYTHASIDACELTVFKGRVNVG